MLSLDGVLPPSAGPAVAALHQHKSGGSKVKCCRKGCAHDLDLMGQTPFCSNILCYMHL
jgi:hypothetical protein